MSDWRTWFTPRRDWQGRHALVPLDTCYRILDLYSWSFAILGTIGVTFVILTTNPGSIFIPVVFMAAVAVAVQWISAVLRGLPFLVRYAMFAGSLLVFLGCAVTIIGITPNWLVFVILLVSSAGLLFGVRAGFAAAAIILVLHVAAAWAWVSGRLPLNDNGTGAAAAYTDFHLARVWVRVLLIGTGMMVALLLLLRYVLGDLNRALAGANAALRELTAEQERRARTERRFADIFHGSPDICGVTRLSDGRILDVNRAFEALTGWTRAEALGRTTTELGFWPSPAERDRVVRLMAEKGEVAGYEFAWRHRLGGEHVGQLSMRQMELDGEPVCNVVIRDLTARRWRERALQAFSEMSGGVTGREFFAATVRHLAEELGVRYALIVEASSPGDGAAVGRTLAVWAGGPAADLTYSLPGSPCENVVAQGLCHYPDRVAELFPADKLLAELGARSYAGLPIRDHTGQVLGLVAVLDDKPMPDAEAASLLLVLVATRAAAELQRLRNERELARLNAELEARVRERTAELAARVAEVERLNAEQQALMHDLRASQAAADRAAARLQEANSHLLAANQELEAFSYSVSHDLRAPLRNIAGFLDLLGRRAAGRLDTECERFIGLVQTETARMGLLIDDLLTLSRIGRTEMHVQPVELAALVADVRAELQPEIGERAIEWVLGPLPRVRGDPALLRQVVANLLGNAVKFTRPRAQARIEVGASPPARGERMHTVFVRDNGAGFNPKYLDKLFGVFQRLHNSREFEGTGIGLANVKRIVTRHGGRVWAEGAVDRGATFYFTLAAAQP